MKRLILTSLVALAGAASVAQATFSPPGDSFETEHFAAYQITGGIAASLSNYLAHFKGKLEVIYEPGESKLTLRLDNGQVFTVEIEEQHPTD